LVYKCNKKLFENDNDSQLITITYYTNNTW